MEHSCHRCGAAVEDQVPFCPQCGAPQIRVSGPPETTPATPPLVPGTPGDVQPPAQPVPLGSQQATVPSEPGRIDWSQALSGTAIGAVLIALWVVPGAFLLWIVGGGVLTVALYQRRRPGPLSGSMGARLGALAGLLGFVLFAVLWSISALLFRGGGAMRAAMEQAIRQSVARNPDPRAQEMLERLLSPEGMALMITFALVLFLVVFVVLSAVGGAIGATLFGKKKEAK